MIKSYNPRGPVDQIVCLLHMYHIPISAVDDVFNLVKENIFSQTVPYKLDLTTTEDKYNKNF